MIHNSKYIKDILNYDSNYYNNNSITELNNIIKEINSINDTNNKNNINKLIEQFTTEERHNIFEKKLKKITHRNETNENKEIKKIVLGFCDMWPGFNCKSNFFIDLLNNNENTVEYIGADIQIDFNEEPDIIIFGPFGNHHETLESKNKNIKKIYFCGENIPLDTNKIKADLYLVPHRQMYEHTQGQGQGQTQGQTHEHKHKKIKYFPTWLIFVNWYSKALELPDMHNTDNPIRLPYQLLTSSHNIKLNKRKEFCAFVVSNPVCNFRNEVFLGLNDYKHVNSGGALFNNTGKRPIHLKYPGGGGGDVAKHEFLTEHIFNLCFENSQENGYITEKLIHAKMAGCIPLYWGDKNAENDFAAISFVNLSECKTKEEAIKKIIELDQNKEQCNAIAETPLLGEKELCAVKELMNNISCEIKYLLKESESASASESESESEITLITFASKNYATQLIRRIKNVTELQKIYKINHRIYLYSDIEKDSESDIKEIKEIKEIKANTQKNTTFHYLPEEATPSDFPDYWNLNNYGWKIYILHTVNKELQQSNNTTVLYADVGIEMLDLPHKLLNTAKKNEIAAYIDKTQINMSWCNQLTINELKASKQELEANQILAGIIAFIPNSQNATKILEEAYNLSKNPKVLKGEKWLIKPEKNEYGPFFGHRHDQTILSILLFRHNIPITLDYREEINETSYKATKHQHKPLYLYRNNYQLESQLETYFPPIKVINLNRRNDRWLNIINEEKIINNIAKREQAVDGKQLQVTQEIIKIFKNTPSILKKSTIGCSLSHLYLWLELLAEPESVNSYLICEDDMRFFHNISEWPQYKKSIPEDAELLYLGGVLPSNKKHLDSQLIHITEHWSKIAPNTLFNTKTPQPIFHFCTYSYIITKSGVNKILDYILNVNNISCANVDHFLQNPEINLNKYVATPLLTYCYQENDENYNNSNFNEMQRKDNYDSDIWADNSDIIFIDKQSNQHIEQQSNHNKITLEDLYNALIQQGTTEIYNLSKYTTLHIVNTNKLKQKQQKQKIKETIIKYNNSEKIAILLIEDEEYIKSIKAEFPHNIIVKNITQALAINKIFTNNPKKHEIYKNKLSQ